MTNDSVSGERRLDPATIERYFNSSDTIVHLLSRNPRYELRVEPANEILELRVPSDSSVVELKPFENIDIEYLEEERCYSLRIAAEGMHYAAYSFIAKIVEELEGGCSFFTAVSRSIGEYELLLQGRKLLTPEKQTGLIGELLVLLYLCTDDPENALASWLGPEAEEHDFSFASFDLEVKTTKSERRTHLIGSATQLEPSANRDLWFLSLQITAAGTADVSFSLYDLVTMARDLLGSSSKLFDDYLSKLGWRNSDSESYRSKYVLRSKPACYRVDAAFPRLYESLLRTAVPHYEHISVVSYRTDVTHLPHNEAPHLLAGFTAHTTSFYGVPDVLS